MEERGSLEGLGFSKGLGASATFDSGMPAGSKFEGFMAEGGEPLGVRNLEVLGEQSLWEVDFPHEVWVEEEVDSWVALHEASSHLARRLSTDLLKASWDQVGSALEMAKVAEAERAWLESVLVRHQDGIEAPVLLRSLKAEVPLNGSELGSEDQFLQTRTVSLEEARVELPLWMDAAKEEVQALEQVTQAVERITTQRVDELLKEGRKVVQIPGKAVLTRKSGVGKRRFRAVCCSNHAPANEFNLTRADLYAGGVDSLTVRIVLGYVSQFDSWTGCSIDIKTAFLHAPVHGGAAVDDWATPLIVVKPPHLLIQMGLMQHNHRWLVRKALYGLQTSPRDWSTYRDSNCGR